MEILEYSSNQDSQLNEARLRYWADRYQLGCANKRPDLISKATYLRAIPKSRRELLRIATQVRARLNSKKLYRVPLVGEATTHYMYVPAFSMKNAQYRAGLVSKGFTVGEPVCLG